MNNDYFGTCKCLTPYHMLNPLKNYKINSLFQNNKNYLSTNLSQLGYQIVHPQYINYQLEPIYSYVPNIEYSKYSSNKYIPKIEIGQPVGDNNLINRSYNYNLSYERSNINYRSQPKIGRNYYKSDTQLILDAINKLQESKNNTTSTRDLTNFEKQNNYRYKNSEINSYNEIEDKKPPLIKKEKISPFERYSKNSNNSNQEYLYKNKSVEHNNKIGMKANIPLNIKINKRESKILLKKKIKRNWLGLFRQFIHLYIFWKSAQEYSNVSIQKRNTEIYIRTKHIVKDIAILKDWVISMEESFFNEFRNYEQFNSKLNKKSQGEVMQILKKNIIDIIKIFTNNLESDLVEIPENVQKVLFKYIKDKCYFPKKYLSKFQIIRLDFNYYGGLKNLSICQSAMILSYLIINGVCVQQILLHIKDIFTEYSNCYNIEGAAKNIGSILHYLVRDIFKKKQKKLNDILALFNYYRNYHLYNEKIEKLKDKINKKINIEENDNDDEYIGLLLSYKEVKEFFDDNTKYIEEFKDSIYNWSIDLSEKIKNKFSKNDFLSASKDKKRKIKSSIYG